MYALTVGVDVLIDPQPCAQSPRGCSPCSHTPKAPSRGGWHAERDWGSFSQETPSVCLRQPPPSRGRLPTAALLKFSTAIRLHALYALSRRGDSRIARGHALRVMMPRLVRQRLHLPRGKTDESSAALSAITIRLRKAFPLRGRWRATARRMRCSHARGVAPQIKQKIPPSHDARAIFFPILLYNFPN